MAGCDSCGRWGDEEQRCRWPLFCGKAVEGMGQDGCDEQAVKGMGQGGHNRPAVRIHRATKAIGDGLCPRHGAREHFVWQDVVRGTVTQCESFHGE
jgi:hypothetical protein